MVRLPLWAMPNPAMNENTSALITSTMAGILISKKGLSSSALSTATWQNWQSCVGRVPNRCHRLADQQDGVGKGDAHSGKEEFSGSVTDVGNGWCYETDDDERYHKAQKLAEDAVEGEKRSDGSFIEEIAEDYTQQDGNDDSCQ